MEDDKLLEDSLQHFGTKGMRWGIRNSRSGSSLGSKVRKAFSKAGKAEKKKGALTDKIGAAKKRPQDMTDGELNDYYNRRMSVSKLKKASSNTSLDKLSREQAKLTLRELNNIKNVDLKKEADRLDTRATQLAAMRPSNNKKPGLIYKTGVGLLKDTIVSDKVIEKILSTTLSKANVKLDERVVKAVGKVLKSTGNAMIDKATNKAYAAVIDKRAKGKYVIINYDQEAKKKEEEGG